MNAKKPLLIAGVATSVAFGSMAGLGVVSAADSTTNNDGQTSLVNKIATRFNLNKDQVKAVFDEDRAAHQAQRQKEVETALSKAVDEGKLTTNQKELILAKRSEIKSDLEKNHAAVKDKTRSERKAVFEQKRAELEKWAGDNNISKNYLRYVFDDSHRGPIDHDNQKPDDSQVAPQ